MILLMFISLLVIWIIVGNNEREPNWRLALVQSLIVWAAFIVLGTEALGWFGVINRTALGIMWSLPILTGILWVLFWLKKGKVLRLPIVYHRDSWLGTLLDILIILILIITAVVAVVSPPNSRNGLIFRMSRVAHWAQNESLAHYATGIETQNSNAPGAEIMQLNFYVLSGNDRTANLVAWIAFAGMVAASASLAEVLGAKVNGQRMTSIFVATIPAAITQATGAMNDIVVSFWIVSTVLMLLTFTRRSPKNLNLVLAAFGAALAILTKTTAFLFLWPFALYMIVILLQRLGMAKMLMWAVIAMAVMGVINGGYFYRNQVAYGQFYRPAELANQTNEVRNWRVMVSNISRNVALHADLPVARADDWLKVNIIELHDLLGISENDHRTTLEGGFYIPEVNTSEQTSGNPLHAFMILFSLVFVVGMVVLGKEDPDILVYAGAVFFSLVLFCYLLKWQPSGGRLQLPFFVLFAPLVAFFLDKLAKFKVETLIAAILLIYAMPWLFQTQERPILPNPKRTYPVSVFNEDREALYFATSPEDYAEYRAIAETITAAGFTRIGLDLAPEGKEYAFWALLGAPDPDLRVEWVATDTVSKRLLNLDFDPQAIICEDCTAEQVLLYEASYEQIAFTNFDLFLAEQP